MHTSEMSMTATTQPRYRVVTNATADHRDGRHINCGFVATTITDADLEAVRYRSEGDAQAASRAARNRRLDDLEQRYRGSWTLSVSEVNVEEIAR